MIKKTVIIAILTVCIVVANAQQIPQINGLKLPRLTTAERDALQIENKGTAAKGVAIYNIDIDCVEYWNGEEWNSLCQTSTPATIIFDDAKCNDIQIKGKYYASASLTDAHYITIPVNVTKKGNYSIIASTGNGYNFQASGIFDETGEQTIKLNGFGTPANVGANTLTFLCNNSPFAITCNNQINVLASVLTYSCDCDELVIEGEYKTRKIMDATNYLELPVNVSVGGLAKFSTTSANGIYFSVEQDVYSGTEDVLTLQAHGTPVKAGTYSYTFKTNGSIKTTCEFEISFTSTLGTFADPACRCLDIYEENPMADNGEYWLSDCEAIGSPVKTYCDMRNGGWTLVWSFSEKTARNKYTPQGTNMTVQGNYNSVFVDNPRNRPITEDAAIDYTDYRLSRAEWQHFPNSVSKPQLKVRITDNPTDMDDEWALNNYGIISPRAASENPIETNFSDYKSYVPAEGKIFGKKFKVLTSGGGDSGGWDEVSGNRCQMTLYSSNSYCTHWNFGNCGSTALFDVTPNRNAGTGNSNQIRMSNINNAFGWFGEEDANHHFGKCGQNSDDYSFDTRHCPTANLYPHSFNNGEGRYLQWFVK